jgi:cytochrome c biogenesis protein CcmG, thiol:disulfide interchange protein DsbE
VTLSAALALAACGTSAVNSASPSPGQARAELRHSPPALAALHAQANRLLGGGVGAFRARVAALRGHPVVVNKWASWCGPCQSEFPVFQRVSLQLGRQVAFVGVDAKDHAPAASAFLRRLPVSYPSYQDPGESIARGLGAATYFPQTVFIDRAGHQVYVHAGPYLSASSLTRDIRFYVLK